MFLKLFFVGILASASTSCTVMVGGVPVASVGVRGGGGGHDGCSSGPSRGGPVPMRHYGHQRGAPCTSRCHPLQGGGGPAYAGGYSGGYSRQPGYGGSNYPQGYNRPPDRPIGPRTVQGRDGTTFYQGRYTDSMGGQSGAGYFVR